MSSPSASSVVFIQCLNPHDNECRLETRLKEEAVRGRRVYVRSQCPHPAMLRRALTVL